MLTGVLLGIGAGLALATAALSLWTMARARRELSELQPSVRGDGRSATWTIFTCGLTFLALAATFASGSDQDDARPLRFWLCVDGLQEPPRTDAVLAALAGSPIGVVLVSVQAAIACPPTLDAEAVRDSITRQPVVSSAAPAWEAAIDLVATRPGPAVCLLLSSTGGIDLPSQSHDLVVGTIDPTQAEEVLAETIADLSARARARRRAEGTIAVANLGPLLGALALVAGLGLWWRQA